MLSSIFGKFLVGIFSSPLLETVKSYFTSKANSEIEKTKTEGTVAVALINAELESRKAQKEILIADQGWWVTAWIRPLTAYPFVLHVSAIALDSTFKFGWGVPKLPSPYDQMEWTILLSFFIARPIEKVATTIFRGK